MSEIHTRPEIAAGLRGLGVAPGDLLLVHTSVKALGWIPGGAVAVVQALRDAVGDTGTIVVPTQTAGNSDPSAWQHPPVPAEWWPVIREHTPAFDPAVTPSEWMGKVPEVVRTWPGARRSAHPQTSFAALGPLAERVVAVHDLDSQCGERSPLATLERLGARVLVLGADFGSCTAFHLAEYRVPAPPRRTYRCVVRDGGGRRWWEYEDVALDDSDFTALGADFERSGHGTAVRTGPVGSATGRLFGFPAAVAFASQWLPAHRGREPA
jgi:aminoglycoside 3-N-acetyltransferase